MSGVHARIAPSSLYLTVACNGWLQLAEGLPTPAATEEELEGDSGHYVAAMYANGREIQLGEDTPNGLKATDEMIDGGILYREVVGPEGVTETPVVVSRIHPTECYGTPDRWRWNETTRTLRVFDYKFGHKFIEVYENWQLIAYAIGVLEMLGITSDLGVTLILTIVQPRSYHPQGPVRSWKVKASDLRAHVNIAMQAAHAALGPKPKTVAGAHCEFCPARHICPTLQEAGADAIEFAGSAEPLNLSAAAVGLELWLLRRAEELIEARKTGLEEQARAMIKRGEVVPCVSLESTKSRLTWLDNAPVDEIFGLGDALGVQLRLPPKPITPTQAKNKGIDEAVIRQYAWNPPGKTKLIFDPNNTQARKAFGALQA
jgi:hypothetical protein